MGGGLLNLVAYGNQNIILNGNPTKTFFKFSYNKYTNFGLQKFRLDVEGQRQLNMTQDSFFTFKIPNYGDLLMDTYLVINLPNIWSPILQPKKIQSNNSSYLPNPVYTQWRPYEFKWIDNLGSQIIKEVVFSIGGQIIQKFSGNYLMNLVERDFRGDKKLLYYEMTGNTFDLNNPAFYSNRNGNYPNAWYTTNRLGTEPSIRAKTLYIPLNIWFTLSSQMAFPLTSLQYNHLEIKFTLRPVQDLFVVRDVTNTSSYWRIPQNIPVSFSDVSGLDLSGNMWPLSTSYSSEKGPYVRPEQTTPEFLFYRFLSQPPSTALNGTITDNYPSQRTDWNADIHLLSTYGFLSEEEVRVFALKPQHYLIKEVYEYKHYNVVGSRRLSFDSMGMVSNWMFFLQRTDVINRNQWSNYTNWPEKNIPKKLIPADASGSFLDGSHNLVLSPCCPTGPYSNTDLSKNATSLIYSNSSYIPAQSSVWVDISAGLGPGTHPGYIYNGSGIKITGNYSDENEKNILINAAILLDGKYRENTLNRQVFSQVEKYVRTFGSALTTIGSGLNFADSGLNCYNFALHSNPFDFQPSGAINLSKFHQIELEINTYNPPYDSSAQTLVICDQSQNIIGINKPVWSMYKYTYDFTLMEERYNVLTFMSGNAALMYAR